MAPEKPPKKNSPPEPENPRAEPGSFVIRGKAWFNEHGEEVIDEYGEIPGDIEEDLVQRGNFQYEMVPAYTQDGKIKGIRKRTPSYELRWCPIAPKPKKTRKR